MFDHDLRPAVRVVTDAWRDTVARAIQRGMADGSIRDDIEPDAAAELLIVLVDGFCVRWLAGSIELARARELMQFAIARLRLEPDIGSPARPARGS